ncbi:MAG: glycosyltransferase family 39 protein [Candidatus Omnitrophica bacterium]|nr:glycosyltransferase family 39 protein [Candidatus Omnitrophota bacterium]
MLRGSTKDVFRRQGILIPVLVVFSLVVLFANLGKRSLWEPDEGRYAEISREMVESGDWLTPRLNYIKHFDKPPITYWLIGSSFRLLGQSEFAGHLPLVILALGGVLVTYSLAKELFGRRCGFLSAIILISSLGYPGLSRVLSTDIIFTFFCLSCYLFFVRKNYSLFYLFMALGFMTKGPVVLIITLIPICAFLIYERKTDVFKEMHLGPGLLLFAAISLSWFVYEILLNKGLLHNWIFQQTLGRITSRGKQPFYFFVPVTIGLFFPWIFFLSPALKRHLSFKRAPLDKKQTSMFLLFLWLVLPLLFFSCIGKKLVPYTLPLLAPLAIMTARLWDEAMDNPKIFLSRMFSVSYYIFLLCLGILLAGMVVFLAGRFDYKLGIEAARLNIIAISIILAGAITVSLSAFKLKKTKRLFWTITLACALFFLTAIDLLPKIETGISKSIKVLALKIKEDLRPPDLVVNYRCFLKSLPFYLSRRTIVVERNRHTAYEEDPEKWREYLLKDKKELYRLLSARGLRVFCITYTWEFEKLKKEYSRPLYLLGKAGKYVLFVNREVRE